MKIYIGSDHAGWELKNELVGFLAGEGHEVVDKGAFEYKEGDDYPDFVLPVARAVASDPEKTRGIVLGGSGQGEAVAANKVKGIRAAVYYGGHKDILTLSREHNDANILSLGARFMHAEEAKNAVKLWLETEFSGEDRHVRRLEKIENYESPKA